MVDTAGFGAISDDRSRMPWGLNCIARRDGKDFETLAGNLPAGKDERERQE